VIDGVIRFLAGDELAWRMARIALTMGAPATEIHMQSKTPPVTLKDIVDAISTRRGVTLYRESAQ
jgi:hypothetical protein